VSVTPDSVSIAAEEALAAAEFSPARAVAGRFLSDRWAVAGLAFLLALALLSLAAPWVVERWLHRSAFELHMTGTVAIGGREVEVVTGDGLPLGPNAHFWLGADLLGRDLLSRLLYGARVSLFVSLLGTALAMVVGLGAGLLAGYYRGAVDTVISRFVDAMMAVPILLLAIALASVMRSGSIWIVILILGLVNWTYLARIIRAEVLSLRERDFIEAARALGASDRAMLVRHLLPNLLGPLIVFATLSVAGNILLESALSFLGVGIRPPTPSWGNMIEEGMPFYTVAWWIMLFPGVAILVTVVSLNLVGDGLRAALAPAGESGRSR
jgi:ABC-type dipeptide/oligopeptide/nickel transport system permease subunit